MSGMNNHGYRAAAFAIVAVVVSASGAARAQGKTTVPDHVPSTNGTGLDLNLFRPAIDNRGFFTVNGADILPGSNISLGLVLDYAHNLLPLNAGHGPSWMVRHAFKGVFMVDYGVADVIVVGISAPLVLNGGEGLTDVGPGGKKNYDTDPLGAQALGDLSLHVKWPILRPDGPIGIALLAQAGVGVGGSRNFASEPGFFYWPQLILEERVRGVLRLALDVGYRGHTGDNPTFGLGRDKKTELARGALEYTNLLTLGFALSVRPARILDLVAESYATYQVGGSSDTRQRFCAEAMFGAKLYIDKSSYLTLGMGPGLARGFQTAAVRTTLGVVYEPSLGAREKPPSK